MRGERHTIRNIGIIAHIDAGKTTVSERILFYSHKEHRIGEVDAGTATMDWMPEEQKRGITITAAATTVYWPAKNPTFRVNLIDTPGHVDFTAEVERSLRVLDGAIGVFCGTAGVQAQSETVWRQANRYSVPRLVFINKLDRVGSDFFHVVDAIRVRLGAKAVPIQIPIGREKTFEGAVDLVERRELRFGGEFGEEVVAGDIENEELREEAEAWRNELIEIAAEYDDALLERYLAGEEVPVEALKGAIRKGTLSLGITPVLCGAALRNKGVQPLLDAVCDYLPAPEDVGSIRGAHPRTGKEVERKLTVQEPYLALAFKTVADPHGDLAYLRIYSGKLGTGEQVWNNRTQKRERAQKIYLMHANQRDQIESAEAGNIVAVIGLRDTVTGDTLTDPSHPMLLEPPRFPETVVTMAIEPVSIADRDKLLESLGKLEREDPTFRWRSDKDTGQIVISGMGELHLEILKERLLREFRVAANVGTPRVAYRQTIQRPAQGEGVFEKQLGGRSHFARVLVQIDPDPDAAKPILLSELRKEKVPLEFHPAVEDGARGALQSGGVLGFPLTQLRVRIVSADFRPGEGSQIAYSTAAAAAFGIALEKAGSVILEPVMRFEVEVPDDYYGTVSADLQKRRAQIDAVELEHGIRFIRGLVPLAEVFGYSNTLRSLSQGRGSISLEPDRYLPVPEEIAARFQW